MSGKAARPKAKGKKISTRPVAKKPKRKEIQPTWCAVGIDISTYSIAMAAIAWDRVLNRYIGPVTTTVRWTKGDHWYTRMVESNRPEILLHDMFAKLKITPDLHEVFIAVEEPWPPGMEKRGHSQTLKQQAQISGALMGGLLRWGWTQVYEIHNTWWRSIVAEDLGISIASHGNDIERRWNPEPKSKIGKYRSQQWANEIHPDWVPEPWPDLITTKDGLIPRPEKSKAKGTQPDDRYDALPIMQWMVNEIEGDRV